MWVLKNGVWKLPLLKVNFEKRLEAFDAAQLVVEASIAEDKLLDDIEKTSLFRDGFLNLRARFGKALNVASDAASSAGSHSAQMKLPKLHLPTFDGNVEKWPLFWESFCSCVDEADLPDVSKLTYLRSLLRGEAMTCIAGLALTGANYQATCDLLMKRFGRPEKLIFIHIQALLNLDVNQDLHKLQDVLLVHIRSLQVLKVEGANYGMFLTPLVLAKLPEEVRLEWARGSEGKEGDLDYLLQFLSSEIERRDRSWQLLPGWQGWPGYYCSCKHPTVVTKSDYIFTTSRWTT